MPIAIRTKISIDASQSKIIPTATNALITRCRTLDNHKISNAHTVFYI